MQLGGTYQEITRKGREFKEKSWIWAKNLKIVDSCTLIIFLRTSTLWKKRKPFDVINPNFLLNFENITLLSTIYSRSKFNRIRL